MSILLFADLHLDQWRQFSVLTENGFNSRLLEQLKVINQVTKIAVDENVTDIIFLGDLINSQGESLPKIVYNAAFFVVNALSKVRPVKLIVGNHDIYRLMHILNPFEALTDVEVIDKTSFCHIEGKKIDMVPWECQLPKRDIGDILLGHCDVVGTKMGNTASKVGFNPGDFEGYERVYLGHLHTRQHFNVPRCKEAMYIGSVMQHNYADTDEAKGVTIISPANGWADLCRLVPIASPRFLQSEVSTKTALGNFSSMVDSSPDYYRLIVRNSKLEIPKYDHRVQVEWDIKESANARMDIKAEESVKDIVYKFVETHNTKLDKKGIRDMIDHVMEGVW